MRILYITPYCPFPIDSGPKNVSGHLAAALAKWHRVSLWYCEDRDDVGAASVPPGFDEVRRFALDVKGSEISARLRITLAGFHPSVAFGRSAELSQALAASWCDYDLIVVDYYWLDINTNKLPAEFFARAMIIGHDAYSLYYDRGAADATSPVDYLRLKTAALLLARTERAIFSRYKIAGLVSRCDVDYWIGRGLRNVKVLRFPVSAPVFDPATCAGLDLARRGVLIVPGGTNAWTFEATRELLLEYLQSSIGRRLASQTTLWAPGLPRSLKELYTGHGINVVDRVENYWEFLKRKWLYVYPKRALAGFQTKIPQAMLASLPCVVHQRTGDAIGGNSGLHYVSTVNTKEVLNAVEMLVDDEAAATRMGCAAREFALAMYSEAEVVSAFARLVEESGVYRGSSRSMVAAA